MNRRLRRLSVSLVFAVGLLGAAVPGAHAAGWQVAGLVNIGEPTLRIVYDSSVYGARERALNLVGQFRDEFWYLEQPGSIQGLMQAGYSDHYNGVQIQVYSNNPYLGVELLNTFERYGINMTACWETPSLCPTWVAPRR